MPVIKTQIQCGGNGQTLKITEIEILLHLQQSFINLTLVRCIIVLQDPGREIGTYHGNKGRANVNAKY